jgi:hypothetical protein
MILKLSIVGLFIVLVVVLTITYYTQLEGFITTKSATAGTGASAVKDPNVADLDACAGITDKTPASKVPLSCLQQIWVNNRCTLKGGYLPDIQSEFAKIANVKNFDDSLINFGVIKMGLDRLITKGPVASGAQCLGPAPASSTGSDLSKGSKIVPPSGTGLASAVHTPAPISTAAGSATNPQRNDVKPQVTMSDTSYDAMALKQKSDLLTNIQKMFRNELLASRSTDSSVIDKTSSSYSKSSSTQQGNEFNKASQKCESDDEDSYRCPKNPDGSCPPVPDMSQYIKKDAIPCWGCSVDY